MEIMFFSIASKYIKGIVLHLSCNKRAFLQVTETKITTSKNMCVI